ncbi:hypothetical protein ACROYT_G033654 [Oculina patagonica]
MENNRFHSVISILDSLTGRPHVVSSTSSPTPLKPVSSKPLSFSISAILGLEDEERRHGSPSIARKTLLSELCVRIPSPQQSYSDTSPRSSPYSDNTSSTSDCDSEPDQVSTHSEQPTRKKRQRTTFSPIEVWELERAYKRRPYLMSEDEEELVQRLGIPARSLKYWFQNRRAKSRKEERESAFIRTTDRLNQFGPFVSRLHLESWQPRQQPFPVNHARQFYREFLTVQSNQLSHTPHVTIKHPSSHQLPMLHPDQFKSRPVAEPAVLPFSRRLQRFQPY